MSLDSLRELEEIEEKILKILQLSKETVNELEKVPDINLEKINELSSEYLALVSKVKSSIQENSRFLRPYHPYGQGNYSLNREVDISEAALRLFQNSSLQSSNK